MTDFVDLALGTRLSDRATIPVPAGVIAGDSLIAAVYFGRSAGLPTPVGWALLTSHFVNSSLAFAMFGRTASASEPASYDFINNFAVKSIMAAYRNSLGFDAAASLGGVYTSPAVGPTINASANELVVTVAVTDYDIGSVAAPATLRNPGSDIVVADMLGGPGATDRVTFNSVGGTTTSWGLASVGLLPGAPPTNVNVRATGAWIPGIPNVRAAGAWTPTGPINTI